MLIFVAGGVTAPSSPSDKYRCSLLPGLLLLSAAGFVGLLLTLATSSTAALERFSSGGTVGTGLVVSWALSGIITVAVITLLAMTFDGALLVRGPLRLVLLWTRPNKGKFNVHYIQNDDILMFTRFRTMTF